MLKNSAVSVNDRFNGDRDGYKPEIEIMTTGNYRGNPKMLCVQISDNGIGIPTENLNKIWNFGYTTANNKRSISGYGYGLPMSRILMESFGGSISIHSIENKRTTVKILINLVDEWNL